MRDDAGFAKFGGHVRHVLRNLKMSNANKLLDPQTMFLRSLWMAQLTETWPIHFSSFHVMIFKTVFLILIFQKEDHKPHRPRGSVHLAVSISIVLTSQSKLQKHEAQDVHSMSICTCTKKWMGWQGATAKRRLPFCIITQLLLKHPVFLQLCYWILFILTYI